MPEEAHFIAQTVLWEPQSGRRVRQRQSGHSERAAERDGEPGSGAGGSAGTAEPQRAGTRPGRRSREPHCAAPLRGSGRWPVSHLLKGCGTAGTGPRTHEGCAKAIAHLVMNPAASGAPRPVKRPLSGNRSSCADIQKLMAKAAPTDTSSASAAVSAEVPDAAGLPALPPSGHERTGSPRLKTPKSRRRNTSAHPDFSTTPCSYETEKK